jgi:intergrase/recombinase
VRSYPISIEDLAKTMNTLRESHKLYYLVYRLMLEGGLRLSHAIHLVENYNPREIVEINGLEIDTPRLVCFYDKGFCEYYVGIHETAKPCKWAYFLTNTLRLLGENAGSTVNLRPLEKYVKRRGLLQPKYMRKAAWRLMIRAMPREVARFIQSRFGELKVSEARYEDLLGEADENYPKYLNSLSSSIHI